MERLELGPARDRHVERLGRDEGVDVEEVEVVAVAQVGEQLRGEAVQVGHHRQRERPLAVGGAADERRVLQRLVALIQPVDHRLVLVFVKLHLDRLEGLDVEDVVAVVQRRLLVVERGEAHALEVAAVALLAAHHDPHRAPLRDVHGLDHRGHLVHERDGAGDVVQHRHLADLLPRHRHVLEQLQHGMRHVLERPEVHAFVVPELLARHVAVVLDNLAHVLGGHVLLRRLLVAVLALLPVPPRIELLPLARALGEVGRIRLHTDRGGKGACTTRAPTTAASTPCTATALSW